MKLDLKYRPKTFDELVGQPQVQVILRKQVELGRVPPLMRFTGKWGTGKTTAGRVLAAALNCPVSNAACGQCESCLAIQEGRHPALWELDAASYGRIEDIRDLKPKLTTAQSGEQVVMFDEAHSLTTTSQNAMLELFENPPPRMHFIILTSEPGKLLDAVISRSYPYEFGKIPHKVAVDRLQQIATAEGLEADLDLLTYFANKGQGSLRNSIVLLDQATSVGITSLAQYTELMLETDFAPSMLAFMKVGDQAKVAELTDRELSSHGDYRYFIAEMISALRDILALKLGASIEAAGKRLALRQTLSNHLDEKLIVGALHLLWDFKLKLRQDDSKSSIQLLTVLLTETLSTGVKRERVVEDPNKVMSIEDLRAFE